jgi:ppGpp synthetase/RelA/SpoT-type nucleotidyltranferase
MPAPESLRNAYQRALGPIEWVSRRVEETLATFCHRRDYLFHGRIKTLESLSEKIEGGRYERWSDLDDLYACTIVVPTAKEVPEVLSFLKVAFKELTVKSGRSTQKAPDVFRFDSTRWYGTLNDDVAQDSIPGVDSVRFEVQVLTAFEFAWVTVSHSLVYKSDDVNWSKLRLASQLKAAVEQIETIIAAYEETSRYVLGSPYSELESQVTIVERFSSLIDEQYIPVGLKPASWRRFASNVQTLANRGKPRAIGLGDAVQAILDHAELKLKRPPEYNLPESGSLFQYVILVMKDLGYLDRALTKVRLVNSSELSEFLGVEIPPDRQFQFDLATDPIPEFLQG